MNSPLLTFSGIRLPPTNLRPCQIAPLYTKTRNADPLANRTPIDRFIIAGLAAKKLAPIPPADPCVLIRRVTFDLTGLQPTPDEVEAFVRAKEPDAAYEVRCVINVG